MCYTTSVVKETRAVIAVIKVSAIWRQSTMATVSVNRDDVSCVQEHVDKHCVCVWADIAGRCQVKVSVTPGC